MIPNEDDFQIGNYDSDLKPKKYSITQR